jgi:hypothetical protein
MDLKENGLDDESGLEGEGEQQKKKKRKRRRRKIVWGKDFIF